VTLIVRVLSENCVPSDPNKPNDATDNASEFPGVAWATLVVMMALPGLLISCSNHAK